MTDRPREIREITDSETLAAMAHPLRRRMLDALHVDGPATVSMLAQRTDQAVGNVSHHLKVLARAGLVTEAPELARDRREHWWREAEYGWRWSSTSFQDEPAAAAIADAALSLNLDYQVGKVRAWNQRADRDASGYLDAAFSSSTWLRLTPDELAALSDELMTLLRRWDEREIADDGSERETVFVFAHGVPARP